MPADVANLWGEAHGGAVFDRPGGEQGQPTYAPLQPTGGTSTGEIIALLKLLHGGARADPWWAQRFWAQVVAWEAQRGLDEHLRRLLAAHGYVGQATATAPRVEALCADLERLKATQVPAPAGTGLQTPHTAALPPGQENRWGVGLPADFQRAGAEIYRNMRNEGSTSVRDWLCQRYQGSRSSPVWTDLWTMASSIDFGLAGANTEMDVVTRLGTSDVMELHLRRLAAYIYEHRTGDKTGAQHMLGASPPGGSTDVAPTWMVAGATQHSKMEHQRDERVHWSQVRSRKGKGDGKGGKDDKKKQGGQKGQETGQGRVQS